MEAAEMTSETCGRTSGNRWLTAWANLVRLFLILDALNLHSKIVNHIDGSCEQKGGALIDIAIAVWGSSLSGMVKSSSVKLNDKGAGVNGQGGTTVNTSDAGVWTLSY